jgi:protein O-GlcNAc transferase
VAALPALRAGHVTFGCFNNPSKLSDPVFDAWAALLRAVPNARLFLKGNALGEVARNAPIVEHFARLDIDPKRLEFSSGDSTVRAHLESYARVDIALDPFPYNGVTTTCEALWMGVPVVTLAGRAHAGRTGVTLLTHAGFPQWVASSVPDYVSIGAKLASDLEGLAGVRGRLRDAVRHSPLTDAEAHTRAVERAFREMWAERCSGNR